MSKQDKTALRYLNTKGITNYREKMSIIGTLKHDVPNLRLDKGKFVTAGLRMYYSGELNDEQSIRSFDTVLNYIHKGNHANEYDYDLNGLSINELSSKYKDNIVTDGKYDRIRSEQIKRNGGNGYTIIPIETYEQAHKYSEYTSWCITHGQNAFDEYTKYGNRFYFCLKEGFENTPKNDEGAPLNAYGLSMISVEVDTNGDLLRITTRYNHDFNGENNDGLCSVEQLEDILDVNFYKVFLPYTRDELHNRGVILFDEVQELLDNGKNLKEIFDSVYGFYDGYARVKLNGKWNFISTDNRLVSPNQWFYFVYNFFNGYAVVELNGKYNWIDINGNYLSEQWFDYCFNFNFNNGYARVGLNGKYNFIDTNGKIVSPNQWFELCVDFNEGYAKVKLNDKCNFIDTNGNYIGEQWFEECDDFSNGYAMVELNGKYNWIDTNGNYLSGQWFDDVDDFVNGYACVKLNGKYNWIATDKRLVSPDQWFEWCKDFVNGKAMVKLNGKWNLIDTNGNILEKK